MPTQLSFWGSGATPKPKPHHHHQAQAATPSKQPAAEPPLQDWEVTITNPEGVKTYRVTETLPNLLNRLTTYLKNQSHADQNS